VWIGREHVKGVPLDRRSVLERFADWLAQRPGFRALLVLLAIAALIFVAFYFLGFHWSWDAGQG
jgi:hypothetical protein